MHSNFHLYVLGMYHPYRYFRWSNGYNLASTEFTLFLGEYTQESMGMAETLIAQSAVGIIWGLFAAQPLIIQSPTGPVLLFEGALYTVSIIPLL